MGRRGIRTGGSSAFFGSLPIGIGLPRPLGSCWRQAAPVHRALTEWTSDACRGLDHHLADCGLPAEGTYCPQAGQANLYPEGQWQAETTGYPDPDGPHCPTRHAHGHGADLGKRLPSSSYGFRPERSVHHAVRTVKMQLQDGTDTRGRWIIEGDLASYFDTVHHRLLVHCVRRRVRDRRFVDLLWRILRAGHIDRGLFTASSEGVPQGGVITP